MRFCTPFTRLLSTRTRTTRFLKSSKVICSAKKKKNYQENSHSAECPPLSYPWCSQWRTAFASCETFPIMSTKKSPVLSDFRSPISRGQRGTRERRMSPTVWEGNAPKVGAALTTRNQIFGIHSDCWRSDYQKIPCCIYYAWFSLAFPHYLIHFT